MELRMVGAFSCTMSLADECEKLSTCGSRRLWRLHADICGGSLTHSWAAHDFVGQGKTGRHIEEAAGDLRIIVPRRGHGPLHLACRVIRRGIWRTSVNDASHIGSPLSVSVQLIAIPGSEGLLGHAVEGLGESSGILWERTSRIAQGNGMRETEREATARHGIRACPGVAHREQTGDHH